MYECTNVSVNSRYMHGRGCSKRHTVGCTDDLSASGGQISGVSNAGTGNGEGGQAGATGAGAGGASSSGSSNAGGGGGGGGRTRRSGLLTVMERPPGE